MGVAGDKTKGVCRNMSVEIKKEQERQKGKKNGNQKHTGNGRRGTDEEM